MGINGIFESFFAKRNFLLTFNGIYFSLILTRTDQGNTWGRIELERLYAALGTLSIIWGTSFLFIKLLVDDLSPWGVVFWRCFYGTMTLGAILWLKKEKINWKTVPILPIILVGVLNNAIPWGFIAASETKISSSLASVVNATAPFWTMIIGFFFFSSHLNKRQWLGIFMGFVGIVVLLELKISQLAVEHLFGVGMMLLATICYGFGTQLSKKYLGHLSISIISFSTLFVATAVSMIMALISYPSTFVSVNSWPTFFSLIALGSLGSGIAYLLFYYLVKEGSPEFASLVTYLVPAMAMVWGYFLLDEYISTNMIFGLILIFLGIYLTTEKQFNKEKQTTKTGLKSIKTRWYS
jgi:drug/metabolite transporter (DMT)-like permease